VNAGHKQTAENKTSISGQTQVFFRFAVNVFKDMYTAPYAKAKHCIHKLKLAFASKQI